MYWEHILLEPARKHNRRLFAEDPNEPKQRRTSSRAHPAITREVGILQRSIYLLETHENNRSCLNDFSSSVLKIDCCEKPHLTGKLQYGTCIVLVRYTRKELTADETGLKKLLTSLRIRERELMKSRRSTSGGG